MTAKITLEISASLLHQVNAAALQCRTTMDQFVCEVLQEKLARMPHVNVVCHKTIIPTPPKIPLRELKAIHKKILNAAAEIHPDDWK